MDYSKIYNSIIENRKINIPDGYTEKHHIIPRCMGGDNSKENLVRLTAREHFICHVLLVRIYPEKQTLIFAVIRMMKHTKNSRVFQWIRETNREIARQVNIGKIVSEETRAKNSKWQSRSYKEKYGEEIANQLKQKRVEQTTGAGNPIYGTKRPKETLNRMMEGQRKYFDKMMKETGSYVTDEYRQRMSDSTKGSRNGMYGKKHSEETKQKMRIPKSKETKQKIRESSLHREKVVCRYCGLKLDKANHNKWHGDKCKRRLLNDKSGICEELCENRVTSNNGDEE